jgi:CRISPR-associated protein Cmr2
MAFDVFVEREMIGKQATDLYVRAQLLAADPSLIPVEGVQQKTPKADLTRQHNRLITSAKYANYLNEQLALLEGLGLTRLGSLDLALLPRGSWLLQCRVALARPLLSKDDEEFHVSDNPVRKDKVFKVPMIASSSWKGTLRAAATREIAKAQLDASDFASRRFRLTCLFGVEKGVDIAEENEAEWEAYLDRIGGNGAARKYRELLRAITPTGFLKGRLHFYPSYFNKMDIEVINPHDRETKAGKLPIYFESVKADAEGGFTLLYAPAALVDSSDERIRREVADDLESLIPALRAMFLEYGFGAKVSSSFGVVKNKLCEPGTFNLGLKGLNVVWRNNEKLQPSASPKPILPAECEEFVQNGEFLMAKPKELHKAMGWSLKKVERYKAAKARYLEYQRRIADWEASQKAKEEEAETVDSISDAQASYFSDTFDSFDELDQLYQILVAGLRKENVE